jgi:hypothetical protein
MATKLKIEKRGDEILIVIPARFGLIWFRGFREDDLNVIFYQNMPNLHNRYKLAERKISEKNPECIRAHKEILRVILDLRFTITLVKRSPGL